MDLVVALRMQKYSIVRRFPAALSERVEMVILPSRLECDGMSAVGTLTSLLLV